jgi:hypothetical protein
MAPINIDAAHAIEITSFPYDYTQTDINEAGVNYTVYYKFTAPVGARVMGAWGYGGHVGSGYRPTIYVEPNADIWVQSQNKPIQFPVVPGTEYILSFTKNVDTAGPESLRVQVEVAPLNNIAAGNILVPDDTYGFPLGILDHEHDYTVINFVKPFAAGEYGDILVGGVIAHDEYYDSLIRIYDNNFAEIATLDYPTNYSNYYIRRCTGGNKFYAAFKRAAQPTIIKTILPTGTYGPTTWTLTGNNNAGYCAASEDESILYFADIGSTNSAIKRWDLVNNVALPDLVAHIADSAVLDIIVLTDDTIVVLYHGPVAVGGFAKRYAADGTLLNTYNFGPYTTIAPHMAYALDNPDSFWIWMHTNGISSFLNVQASDGTILTTRLHLEFEGGQMWAAETATPLSRFGNSWSCPFFIKFGTPAPAVRDGGIYFISPNKTTKHDSYYDGIEKKIPDPTVRLGFIGD